MRLLPSIFLAVPLAAQVAPDGEGWGYVRIGAEYEAVKVAVKNEGNILRYKLGEGPGEETTYGKRFGAKPGPKPKSPVKEYRVFSEKWNGKIWDIYVTREGVDTKGIRAELERSLGVPESVNGDNVTWRSEDLVVTGWLPGRSANLHFLDKKVNDKIIKQQLIDQGLEKE